MSGRLAQALARSRRQRRAALVPFLTAGYPAPELTVGLLQALERGGADMVELGVPFSDPIADGPTIQRSSEQALAQGTTLQTVLEMVREVRRSSELPLILFTYFNPVHAFGIQRFAGEAAVAGADGVLMVDVPAEEMAAPAAELSRAGLSLVPLVAPTSTPERVRALRRRHGGLVYLAARTGVTGCRDALPEGLEARIRAVRRLTGAAVAVGFGISTPDQVRRVASFADAVVVGSALVERLGAAASGADPAAEAARYVRTLAEAVIR